VKPEWSKDGESGSRALVVIVKALEAFTAPKELEKSEAYTNTYHEPKAAFFKRKK